MPFFQYQATDKQGNPIQGTVQAGSMEEANRALSLQGFRVSDIRDPSKAPAPQPQVRIAVPAPVQGPVARPVAAPLRVNTPAPMPIGEPRKTRFGTEKDLYFLFSQIASYLKSGQNATTAFNEVGSRYPRADYQEAFRLVAAKVAEGKGIAEILQLYPFLFPPHVVGQIRAGELGGYLPEAMDTIVGQADASRKMRRWFIWLGLFVIGIPPVIPLGKALFGGVLRSWDAQEATGGNASVSGSIMSGFVKELMGPLGIISLVVLFIFPIALFIWQSMPFRLKRHRMVLRVPTVGKRARAESFSAFAWNLSNLSKAGISPRRCWSRAAETVPNLAIRASLEHQGTLMTDQSKLSEALHGTKMLPYELSAMVQTGEITGDVPGQLMNGAKSQQDEFQNQDKAVKTRVGCWILIVNFGLGALVFLWLYRDFLLGLIQKLTQSD